MAKSTKAQEVSTGTSASYTEHELTDPLAALRNRPMLGEVKEPSVGMDSSQSLGSESTKSASGSQSLQPPAPTTENPSGVQGKGSDSTADLTAGDGPSNTEPPPFDEELEGFDDEEDDDSEDDESEEDESETEAVEVKPAVKPAKKTATGGKKARVRSTDADFAGLD